MVESITAVSYTHLDVYKRQDKYYSFYSCSLCQWSDHYALPSVSFLNGSGDETPGLKGAADQLKAGVDSLVQGLSDATSETGELSVGLNKLVTGSSKLAAGEAQLSDGASELAAGMNELYSKSGLLISGIGQLDAGSKKLNDGMSQFYKEGIGKIVSLYNDKLKGTVNNAESLVAAGKAYNTFTQVPDGMDGTVKFIYRTKVAD